MDVCYGLFWRHVFNSNAAQLTLAAFFTKWEEDNNTYDREHDQYYIIYAHPLPIDGTTIRFAASQAAASDDDPSVGDSDALGFKVRLNYNF